MIEELKAPLDFMWNLLNFKIKGKDMRKNIVY